MNKNRKSFLVIGAGTFGSHLCPALIDQGCEVMLVDNDEEALSPLLSVATSTRIADCTNRSALESFDIPRFDACFVCLGGNFQKSLEITDLLKETGAKKVFCRADNDVQEKFLLRNGADGVIYPERDMAKRVAIRESSDSIFDFVPITDDYSIYEISVYGAWIGKNLKELNMRSKYGLSVLVVKNGNTVLPLPAADYVFRKEDHVTVLGRREDIAKVIR